MFTFNQKQGLTKRSSQVSLVLLGSLLAVGCSRTDTYQYKNIEDCKKDWGEEECKRNGEQRYHGGSYYYHARANRDNANKAKHATHVKRGGFGSRFSSGRS